MQVDLVATHDSVAGFVAVPMGVLRRGSMVDFDLYVRGPGRMVLYRERNLPFSGKVARRLEENGVDALWISADHELTLGRYVEDHLEGILDDPTLPPRHKAQALYTSARSLAIDILTLPTGEKLKRTRPLVAKTVNAVAANPQILSRLLHDLATSYQLHTHSVNVSVYASALARHLGHRDLPVVTEFALGGMLHDIGKSKVPEEILEKPGPLSEQEWAIMRMHPQWGVEMLGDLKDSMGRAVAAILTHHERNDGQGYPHGLTGEQIPLAGRIVGIDDTFDALTTKRAYGRQHRAYEALQVMLEELSGKFEPELLKRFIVLWGPGGLGAG